MRQAHGLSKTPEFRVWWGIIKRCEMPACENYKNYGGRGIRMCDRWRDSFAAFYSDMGPRPSRLHTIDRLDNDGPYCKENCKWGTRAEQSRNRRVNVFVVYRGVRMVIEDACREAGIIAETVLRRRRLGWPESDWFIPADRHRTRRHNTPRKLKSEPVFVEYGGQRRPAKEVCRETGIPYGTVFARRRKGWPDASLFLPVRRRRDSF